MRIMIAYDGSEYSDAVLDDLSKAGLPRTANVSVVSVADIFSIPSLPKGEGIEIHSAKVEAALRNAEVHGKRIVREANENAQRASERVKAQFPEWNVEPRVLSGTPAWELIDAASEWGADLIVMGSHGRTGIKRLVLGSVSKKVVTDSSASVRIARSSPEKPEGQPIRIVVGVDGSLSSEQAIRAIGMRVWPIGTEVHLVSVDDAYLSPMRISTLLPRAAEMISGFNSDRKARVEGMMEWGANELSQIGLSAIKVTEAGDPKSVITSYAERIGADSIFVGTRDFKNAFERVRLGSVSTAIVTAAHCSVEVVRLVLETE